MREMIIRRMTLADAEQVHEIEKATFPHPWSLASFKEEMTTNPVARYLVAEEEKKLLGFAGVHIILDEGHITNVAIAKERRGQGIGTRLFGALMQYAANLGVRYMTLEVRVSNQKAIRLYERYGFMKVYVRKQYYEDNREDALLMVCDRMPPAQEDFTEEETLFET